jgi:signal transduction histidine kinase
VYVLAADLGRLVAWATVTPVWPPTGVALAALLRGGHRLWPGVFAGVVVTVGFDVHPLPLPVDLTPLAVLAMAVGNTGEAVLSAALLRRIGWRPSPAATVRETLALLTIPPFVTAPLSATVGTLTLLALGKLDADTFGGAWWTWWTGNALGVVTLTPFLLTWSVPPLPSVERSRRVEVTVFVTVAMLATWHALFGPFPRIPGSPPAAYLLFPFLIWTALRFGPRATATAVFGISAVMLLLMGLGQFGDPARAATTLPIQLFLGVMSSTSLLLAASDAERRRDVETLRQLRRDLEAQVRNRTSALEASNRDLEAFAHRVSHDLRAPLRAVNGFCGVLMEEHGRELSPEGRALLRRVSDRARQMARLVEALLEYSRVGRAQPRLADVDVGELVAAIVAEAGPRDVVVEVGELGHATADPVLLRQVFANLVENGVKYSRTQPAPRVVVGREKVADRTAWFVRDNGVGFDMRDADRLFRVFSRLHGSEFEGTGVGLAIVQRIVELHGGRVWAESQPGKGATFWFTLADTPPPEALAVPAREPASV